MHFNEKGHMVVHEQDIDLSMQVLHAARRADEPHERSLRPDSVRTGLLPWTMGIASTEGLVSALERADSGETVKEEELRAAATAILADLNEQRRLAAELATPPQQVGLLGRLAAWWANSGSTSTGSERIIDNKYSLDV